VLAGAAHQCTGVLAGLDAVELEVFVDQLTDGLAALDRRVPRQIARVWARAVGAIAAGVLDRARRG